METTKTFLEVPGKGLRWACSTWRTGPRRETEIPQIGGDAAHTPLPPGPPLPRAGRRRRGASTGEQERRRITQGIAAGVGVLAMLLLPIWAPASLHAADFGSGGWKNHLKQHRIRLALWLIMCNKKFRKSPICTWGNPQESRQLELISASGRC
jgi:hypothetical protein